MARSIAEIQALIIADVQADPTLVQASSTSKRAIWRLWTYVVATAIAMLEQLQDVFKSDVETTVSLAAPQTLQWLQDRCFKFQYSDTVPQVLQLINFVPSYPIEDDTLKIITRASIRTTSANNVLVKVAKSETPEALTSPEIAALQTYVNTLGVAGIKYIVQSTASDKIYIAANIFYQGSYASIIQTNVIAAIDTYLASLPFDGKLKLIDLEIAIRNVQGVNDVVLTNVKARNDSTSLSAATDLVLNNAVIASYWNTVAGYIITETTGGSTITDTLTFIPQ